MALRKQALSYGDEASQYGFESFKEYKKGNRGGGRGFAKGAGTGALTGALAGAKIGATGGTIALPGLGTLAGGIGGAVIGGLGGLAVGGTAGAIGGNRKMKKEYLKYAKEQTAEGLRKAYESSPEKAEADRQAALDAEALRQQKEQQQAIYKYGLAQPMVAGEMPMYKKGGVAKMVTINIEKGELAVDPRTMKVIMDFNEAPKHPKGKDVINQKGNVQVPVGTIIIPADMRKEFLKAKPQQRIEIAAELIERQREGEEKEMEKEGMEGEEMAMQEQMPQGQGMMAMMGGEGEEEGEDMEEAKMGMGGYVKKYQEGTTGVLPTSGTAVDLSGGSAFGTGTLGGYNPLPYQAPAVDQYQMTQEVDTGYQPVNIYQKPQTAQRTSSRTGSSGLVGGLATGLGMIGAAYAQNKLGKFQIEQATKGLTELQKQKWAKYLPTAQLEQQARDTEAARKRGEYGFTPEELAARQQQVAQAQRTAYQRSRDTGLSGANQAVMAALGSQRLGALNQMAIEDARMRLQKQQYADTAQRSLAQQYQSLANAQTAQDIRYRTMQEQAYGTALQRGYENKYGAAGTLGTGIGYGLGAVAGASLEKYLDLI